LQISIEGLTKRYGALTALDDVSLEIEAGQIVAVLGSNGAGKTTLFRCLATICAPTSGSIQLGGEKLLRSRIDLRRRLFFLPDFPLFHPWHTPVNHIAMVARLYDKEALDPDRVFGILEDLDLLGCGRAPMMNLSRGQLYKTALAALFAVEPELLVLDEPFASGMDPHGIGILKKWIRAAQARGTTVLYSTQILEVAEAFSDRVAILHRGRLRAFDPIAKLEAPAGTAATGLATILESLRREGA
jgi:ABC-type multidrug transport system ATPase subunit